MKEFSLGAPLKIFAILTVFVLLCGSYTYAVTPQEFGGKGDVVTLRDGAVSAGASTLESASAKFEGRDAGKSVVVVGAGVDGTALVTTIQSVTSPTHAILAANAERSVQNAITYYGTNDTEAVRACVYKGTTKGGVCNLPDGATFMVSGTKTMIALFGAGNNPIQRGTIKGHGRIIYAPQGSLVGNDRLFYISSSETKPMKIAGHGIAKGATSFMAEDPVDAAKVSAGDWLIIAERDSVVKDHVYADWMQVAGVNGREIHTATPFRMAFPNARPWGGPPAYWGLSFRRVGPITSNVEVHDITIIVPKIKGVIVGIATRDSRGTLIDHITCQDASGNCFAGYMDQGLTIQNSNLNESIYTEVAAAVDTVISGDHINQTTSSLLLPGPPTSGGLEVDFGTGFSRVVDNIIGASKQVCINASPGVHDTIIKGNTCGLVTFGSGASCIFARGGYNLTITENTCRGGTQNSHGIDLADAPNLAAPMYSTGNRVYGNTIEGYRVPINCLGRMRSDNCEHR